MLGNVIHALTTNCEHIPYRDSKLTRILQESVGGNFKTSLIVTCSPHSSNREESISSLKFASRAKCIKNHFKMNIHNSPEAMIAIIDQLRSELEECKGELAKFKYDIFEKNRMNLQINPQAMSKKFDEHIGAGSLSISSATNFGQNSKGSYNKNLSKFRTLGNQSKAANESNKFNKPDIIPIDSHSEPMSPSRANQSKDYGNPIEIKDLDSISNELYGSTVLEKNNSKKYFLSNPSSGNKTSTQIMKQSEINTDKNKNLKKNSIKGTLEGSKAILLGSKNQTLCEIPQTSTNLKIEEISINKILATNLQISLDDKKCQDSLMKTGTIAEFALYAENDNVKYEERTSNTSDPKSKKEYQTYTYFKTNLELINQNEILEMRVKSLKSEIDNLKGTLVETDKRILNKEEENMQLRNSLLQMENKYNEIMEDKYMANLKLDTQKSDTNHLNLTIQVLQQEVNAFTDALGSCEQSIQNLLKEKSRTSNYDKMVIYIYMDI